ncbi:hypothetical protein HanPSC8_Chr09g0378541 [Helianthus annuus]|nr:hypothetical protein HanPSC8_Chr09g0378541 [Helianthus annuus]
MLRGCRRHRGFWLGYDEEAHVGRCAEVSMLNQVTGRCFECRMLLVPQISSQICPETQDITTRSSEERASSPTTAFMAWTSFPMA